jgi:hypothetical protein
MIEFDVKCRSCQKGITLGVRDAQARAFFEQYGALCESCDPPGYRPTPIWQAQLAGR